MVSSGTLEVDNVEFSNIETQSNGGGIRAVNSDVVVNSSVFKGNKAFKGAGMNIECVSLCSTTIDNTEFKDNIASYIGGGYAYNNYIPITSNIKFSNNQAQYGPDIASYARSLTLTFPHPSTFTSPPSITTASGQPYNQTLSLQLLDIEGQLITVDSSSVLLLSLASSESSLVSVKGQVREIANKGLFTFKDLQFTVGPDQGEALF